MRHPALFSAGSQCPPRQPTPLPRENSSQFPLNKSAWATSWWYVSTLHPSQPGPCRKVRPAAFWAANKNRDSRWTVTRRPLVAGARSGGWRVGFECPHPSPLPRGEGRRGACQIVIVAICGFWLEGVEVVTYVGIRLSRVGALRHRAKAA